MDLTKAQLRVAALVAEGLTNRAIGQKLGIDETTVGVHVKKAHQRLGLANRVQLAVWYVKHGSAVEPAELSDHAAEAATDRVCRGRCD